MSPALQLPEHNLLLVLLTPKEVDLYFHYKQVEAARRNKIDIAQVSVTFGRYYRTNLGSWTLIIEKLQLKDGTW